MSVLTDIKNRRTDDILIACMEPKPIVDSRVFGINRKLAGQDEQRIDLHCIVYMIRNSTKFMSHKDLKAVCKDLKEVYSAINVESGHKSLMKFGKK